MRKRRTSVRIPSTANITIVANKLDKIRLAYLAARTNGNAVVFGVITGVVFISIGTCRGKHVLQGHGIGSVVVLSSNAVAAYSGDGIVVIGFPICFPRFRLGSGHEARFFKARGHSGGQIIGGSVVTGLGLAVGICVTGCKMVLGGGTMIGGNVVTGLIFGGCVTGPCCTLGIGRSHIIGGKVILGLIVVGGVVVCGCHVGLGGGAMIGGRVVTGLIVGGCVVVCGCTVGLRGGAMIGDNVITGLIVGRGVGGGGGFLYFGSGHMIGSNGFDACDFDVDGARVVGIKNGYGTGVDDRSPGGSGCGLNLRLSIAICE